MIHSTHKRGIVALKELRLNLGKYILRAKKGESFTVVRRSRPIFVLSPVDTDEESAWETVVDFRNINPRGVPATDVLKALHRLHEQDRKVSRRA